MPPKLIVRMYICTVAAQEYPGSSTGLPQLPTYCWPPPLRAACLTALPAPRICPTRSGESRLIAVLLPQRLPSDVVYCTLACLDRIDGGLWYYYHGMPMGHAPVSGSRWTLHGFLVWALPLACRGSTAVCDEIILFCSARRMMRIIRML